MSFTVRKRLQSFRYALVGIETLVRTQHNMWIHLAATFAVASAGVYFSVTRMEWIALFLAVALVWITEGLNTAVEFLGDAISKEQNDKIGKAKDIAAGAVLFAALAAAGIGLFVFLPYLLPSTA